MNRYPWLLPLALVVIGIKCIILYGGGLILLAGLFGAFFGLGWAITGMVGVTVLLAVGGWLGYAAKKNVCPVPPGWIRAMKRRKRSPRATLVRSEPAAGAIVDGSPSSLRVWFGHPVSATLSKVWVVDASGATVQTDGSRPDPADPTVLSVHLPELPAGAYTVHWRSLSAETGQSAGGQFAFVVAEQAAERPLAVSQTA